MPTARDYEAQRFIDEGRIICRADAGDPNRIIGANCRTCDSPVSKCETCDGALCWCDLHVHVMHEPEPTNAISK